MSEDIITITAEPKDYGDRTLPEIPEDADNTVIFFSENAQPPGRVYKYAWVAHRMRRLKPDGPAIQITFVDSRAADAALQGVKLAWKNIGNQPEWTLEYKTRKSYPGSPDHPEKDLFIWRTA